MQTQGGPRLQQVRDCKPLELEAALLHALGEERLYEGQQRRSYGKGAEQHEVGRENRVDQVLRQELEQHEQGHEHRAPNERELHGILALQRKAPSALAWLTRAGFKQAREEAGCNSARWRVIAAAVVNSALSAGSTHQASTVTARSLPTFLLML